MMFSEKMECCQIIMRMLEWVKNDGFHHQGSSGLFTRHKLFCNLMLVP